MCTGPHAAGTAAHTYSLVSAYATPFRICRNYAFTTRNATGMDAGARLLCAVDGA